VKHKQDYKNQPTLIGWLAFSRKNIIDASPLHKSRQAFLHKLNIQTSGYCAGALIENNLFLQIMTNDTLKTRIQQFPLYTFYLYFFLFSFY